MLCFEPRGGAAALVRPRNDRSASQAMRCSPLCVGQTGGGAIAADATGEHDQLDRMLVELGVLERNAHCAWDEFESLHSRCICLSIRLGRKEELESAAGR
jgi:hypothetical protein